MKDKIFGKIEYNKLFSNGDKVKVKNGFRNRCIYLNSLDWEYLLINGLTSDKEYYFSAYTKEGKPIGGCTGCYDDRHFELL